MPPCIFIPRILEYNMHNSPEENNAHLSLKFYSQLSHTQFPSLEHLKSAAFRLNPFFVLTKVADLPQKSEDLEDSEGSKPSYIVNGLFGNEDFSSIVRVILIGRGKAIETICDRIIEWRT